MVAAECLGVGSRLNCHRPAGGQHGKECVQQQHDMDAGWHCACFLLAYAGSTLLLVTGLQPEGSGKGHGRPGPPGKWTSSLSQCGARTAQRGGGMEQLEREGGREGGGGKEGGGRREGGREGVCCSFRALRSICSLWMSSGRSQPALMPGRSQKPPHLGVGLALHPCSRQTRRRMLDLDEANGRG